MLLRHFQNFRKSYITFRYLLPLQKRIWNPIENLWCSFLAQIVKSKSSIVDIWRGSKYVSVLFMDLSKVFFCFVTVMGTWWQTQIKQTWQYTINHWRGLFLRPQEGISSAFLRQNPSAFHFFDMNFFGGCRYKQ